MSQATAVPAVLSKEVQKLVPESKILVVGAGGIGCEILKNLALSGFQDIEIIDLDTIDVSNLNRQFLFRKEHVGKSKAQVARETILNYNPDIKIKAYHDSITTSQYGVNFFKKFKVVLNALDNRAARNHVNRMCLAADVPLIESGTSGYTGQMEFIKKGLTQCYECQPKAPQRTFPGCTIRNTPSEPVHCIVWAKHLYNQLFGEEDPDQDVSPNTADPEAAGDAGQNAMDQKESENGNVERTSTRQWAEEIDYDPAKLFNKFFEDDINYLLSMENLWKKRKAPKPLSWAEAASHEGDAPEDANSFHKENLQVWSISKCSKVFASTISLIKKQFETKKFLVWDKDDVPAMDFVTACANIRSHVFGIPLKSRFDVKSIAGNIIPAIATTNAMVAGLVVLQTFRVLKEEYEKCLTVYVRQKPSTSNIILRAETQMLAANPKCYVCSPQPFVNVFVDTNVMTVKEFDNEVLKKGLNMIAPDAILDGKGVVVISSEEGETECNNDKTLAELGIVDGSILKVDDFVQSYELSVCINQYVPEIDQPAFKIASDVELKAKPQEESTNGNGTANGKASEKMETDEAAGDDDDVKFVETAEVDDPQEGPSKRRKPDPEDDDDLILLED